MKNNKGITLIVLIITIIIMLILVGVIINIAIDDNLIKSAQNAVDQTNDRVGQTQSRVNELMGVMEDITATSVSLTLEHTERAVTADGTKVARVVDGVPIPVGFVASGATGENTKADGLVIYEGNDAVTNSNVETARTTRNQFVWVPVLQNQKIKINVRANENITRITLTDPFYEEMTIPAPTGNTYIQEIKPKLNGLYTLTVQIGEEEITKKIEIHSLYALDFWIEYEREDCYWQCYGFNSVEEMLTLWEYESLDEVIAEELEIEKNNYIESTTEMYEESVNKYGGFYIARYEAGKDGENAIFKKNKTPYNNINYTNTENKANLYPMSASVISYLINGEAWDSTLNWLVEEQAISKMEMAGDSVSWGNYYDSEISGLTTENQSTLLNTGITEYTKRKNIYDLAGNLAEWTTERTRNGGIKRRGGIYDNFGNRYTASSYYYSTITPERGDDHIGFRTTLYIKP